MLQYLVILLDDTSVAYCHADNPLKERNLMPVERLKQGILFGMKHNLMIQYVFPAYQLPKEYAEVIESIDNVKIYPSGFKPVTGINNKNEAHVEVTEGIPEKIGSDNLLIRMTLSDILAKREAISHLFSQEVRVNICITDVEKFSDEQIAAYKQLFNDWNAVLLSLSKQGKAPQLNLLTDRIMLEDMHNCEAGVSNITLAPNGNFYICPAFYYDEKMQVPNQLNHHTPSSDTSVGSLEKGLEIPNRQLLQLDHAPLCRICDAYQCRRCVWLNQKLTWDINTPSHQQCVMAHIERNASRELLYGLSKLNTDMQQAEIKEIGYLDPFDVVENFE